MKKKYLLFLVLNFLTLSGYCQVYSVTGKVIDENSSEALAFVSLVINGGRNGTYSDLDGKFSLKSDQKINFIRVSLVGYQQADISTEGKSKNLIIKLQRANIQLSEVVITPKVNPAHRIILKATENRDRNNPEHLNSFSYVSYDKIIFTTDVDSLMKIDSIPGDTSLAEMKAFFKKQDFGVVENVVERKFRYPDKNYQKVIATRVSGFKDPIFVFLLSQLQSTTFYQDLITILDKNYINPVSYGSTGKYLFQIQDTIIGQGPNDTTFVISFRPFKNTNFDGLKGVLYIHTDGYAIQNVKASPAREETNISIKIQQMYNRIDSTHWFPVQLNTDLTFKGVELTAGKHNFYMVGIGKSYIRNVEINQKIPNNSFSEVAVYVDPEATKRPQVFWDQFRQDSLSTREIKTYAFMDSVGKAMNLDKMARSFETMMTGKIPWGYFDLDINKILRYNGFEGYYLGMGAMTNERLSPYFKVGGYWGYGFKDQTAKYGGELDFLINRSRQAELKLFYRFDAYEPGGVNLVGDAKLAVYERVRNLLLTRLYYNEGWEAMLTFRALRYFKWDVGFRKDYKTTTFNYLYDVGDINPNLKPDFHFTTLYAGFRFAFKEKFLKNSRTQISLGTDWPIVNFQFSQGFKGWLEGEFNYQKIDLRITKSFYTKYIGRTSLCVAAGAVKGEIPYTDLYNGHGSYQQFSIYAPNSFATMEMNEFVSKRYIAAYFTHSFGKLLVRSKHFSPEIQILTHAEIGNLSGKEKHYLYHFNTLEKGYYESGFLLNDLYRVQFSSLGVGVFYRYGAYSYPDWQKNISIKFSMTMPF